MAQILSPPGLGTVAFAANIVSPLAQFSQSGVASLFFAAPRRIGTVIPGVVIEENGRDELDVTRHPVERGAPITDHAYLLPSDLVVRCAWSAALFGPSYLRAVYQALRELQASREPFTVSTGKRLYGNMLMRTLVVDTAGPQHENILMVTCTFQEVSIVETAETTVAPRSQQAAPHDTAPPVQSATVNPVPVADPFR